MLKRIVAGAAAAIVAVGFVAPAASAAPSDIVNFPDAVLKECVNVELGQAADADVTEAQIDALTSFECDVLGISDLAGLEEAMALMPRDDEGEEDADASEETSFDELEPSEDEVSEELESFGDEVSDVADEAPTPKAAPSDSVNIPDARLKECVNSELRQAADADVTEAQIGALTRIDCYQRGISDLTGLENADSLQSLALSG